MAVTKQMSSGPRTAFMIAEGGRLSTSRKIDV